MTPRFALGHKDPRRGEAGIQPPSGLLPGMQHDVVIFDNKACRLAATAVSLIERVIWNPFVQDGPD